MAQEVEEKRTKKILSRVEELVRENHLLYEALKETGAFPKYMVYMVQVGETTGKLEEVLRSLARYYERDANVRAAVRSAVVFPLVLFAMMAVIMLVLIFKIIPMFEEMFLELNAQVADSTRRMMEFGVLSGKVLAVLTCVLFLIFLSGAMWYRTAMGEKILKGIAQKLGPFRRMMRMTAVGQFISALGLMMASGMEQVEALELAGQGCTDSVTKGQILKCKELIGQGEGFDEALANSGLLVGRENRMLSIAMKTGATDEMLNKLGMQYDERIGNSLGGLSGRIETVMVIALAVMVGTVLISIMLPLVSMISSIG